LSVSPFSWFALLLKIIEKFLNRITLLVCMPTALTGAGDRAIVTNQKWQVALRANGHPLPEGAFTSSVLDPVPKIDFLGVLVFQPVQIILQSPIFVLQFRYSLKLLFKSSVLSVRIFLESLNLLTCQCQLATKFILQRLLCMLLYQVVELLKLGH